MSPVWAVKSFLECFRMEIFKVKKDPQGVGEL